MVCVLTQNLCFIAVCLTNVIDLYIKRAMENAVGYGMVAKLPDFSELSNVGTNPLNADHRSKHEEMEN